MKNGNPQGWPLVYRTGYYFEGWYFTNEKEGRGNPVNQTDIVRETRNHTLFAHWKKKTYTITFDPNGDGATANPTTKEVIYGEPYGELAEADKLGHTFSGWWTQSTDGIRVTAETIVTEETINPDDIFGNKLYAHWTPNTYYIEYDPGEGGSGTMERTVATYGQWNRTRNNTFTREGYEFDGWYAYRPSYDKWLYELPSGHPSFYKEGDQPDGTNKKKYNDGFSSSTIISKNGDTVVLVAQWKPNEYTVTFNANRGTTSESEREVIYGETYGGVFPTPTREGYIFEGWYTDPDAGTRVQGHETVNIQGDHTLYAHWRSKYAEFWETNKSYTYSGNTYGDYKFLTDCPDREGLSADNETKMVLNTTFSLEDRVRLEDRYAEQIIVGCTENSGWGLRIDYDGYISFIIYDNGTYFNYHDNEEIRLGEVYNVTVVYDGTEGKIEMYIRNITHSTGKMIEFETEVELLNQRSDIPTIIGENPISRNDRPADERVYNINNYANRDKFLSAYDEYYETHETSAFDGKIYNARLWYGKTFTDVEADEKYQEAKAHFNELMQS